MRQEKGRVFVLVFLGHSVKQIVIGLMKPRTLFLALRGPVPCCPRSGQLSACLKMVHTDLRSFFMSREVERMPAGRQG